MRSITAQPSHKVNAFAAQRLHQTAHVCPRHGPRRVQASNLLHTRHVSRTKPCCKASTGPGSASNPQKPTSISPDLTEKQIDVTVYQPSGVKSTEKRTVKVDMVEAAAIQQNSIAAAEQSKRLRDAQTEAAVDNTARNVEKGVDQAANAAQDGINQLSEGVQEGAEQVQKGADQLERNLAEGAEQLQQGADELDRNATEVRQELEQNLEEAADAAADTVADVASQAQAAAQGVADSASSYINSLQKGAQTAAPYQDQPLTSMEPNPYGPGTPGRKPSAENQVQYFKLRLLECIVGLDRGFSASPAAAAQVESATLSLTGQSSPVSLSWTPAPGQEEEPSGLALLSGTWRLVYSSGFASGRYGNQQPSFPGTLGQVYQVISPYTSRLDNVLELSVGLPGLKPVVCTVTLKHHFEALGGNIVQITVEDTEVKVTGGLGGLLGNLPEIVLPQLPEPFRPSRQQRTSSFDVLFLDSNMRIIRGSRGELRIFVKT